MLKTATPFRSAVLGSPPRSSPYSASKAGIESLPKAVSRFGYRLPGPLDTPSAVQLVATRLRQAGLPLNVFLFAIILQLLLARFNVIAARARSTFS